jgi:DNA polymerase
MDVQMDYYAAKAALEWMIELGADEAISDAPLNRYEAPKNLPKMGPTSNIAPVREIPNILPVEQAGADIARAMAASCQDLEGLRNALGVFDMCALKKGARNLVFGEGAVDAKVMVITEAPNQDEDRAGLPFVGEEGAMFDKMFAAIGLTRQGVGAEGIYVTNVLPWRPPQNREPSAEEISMMLPFLERHIALINPDILVLIGNAPCQAVLGTKGILRLRGRWSAGLDRPVIPMLHPRTLRRDTLLKRDAWADLLSLKDKMEGT